MRQTILFLIPYNGLGGAEINALRLIESLSPKQFRVTAVLPEIGPLQKSLNDLSIPTFVFNCGQSFKTFSWFDWIKFKYGLEKFLKQYPPTLIHNNSMYSLKLGLKMQNWLSIPLITHWHDNQCHKRDIPAIKKHRKFPIICVSNSVKKTLESEVPFQLQLRTIYNGIDHIKFQTKFAKKNACHTLGLDSKVFYVGFLGLLTEHKGLSILIEAFAQLNCNHIHLVVAGKWDCPHYKIKTYNQIASLGLENRIHFIGFQDKAIVLSAISCLAVPSTMESFSLCTLEAMAYEIPVIAHAVGGICEQIHHGKTGILITEKTANEWAHHIQYLYNNPNYRLSIAKAGKVSSQKFDLKSSTKAIEDLYHLTLSQFN